MSCIKLSSWQLAVLTFYSVVCIEVPSDQILEQDGYQKLLMKTSCLAKCDNKENGSVDCSERCMATNQTRLVYETGIKSNITLSYCKFISNIHVFLPYSLEKDPSRRIVAYVTQTTSKPMAASNTSIWVNASTTQFTSVTFANLELNRKYRFRFTPVTENGSVLEPITTQWIKTLGGSPNVKDLTDLQLKQQILTGKSISALFSWTVGKDVPCFYKLFLLPLSQHGDYAEYEVKYLPRPSHWFTGLKFGCKYEVKVEPYWDRTFKNRTDALSTLFFTMECLNATSFNYNICAPEPPRDAFVNETITYEVDGIMFGNITIAWISPEHTSETNVIQQYIVKWNKAPPAFNLQILRPHKGKGVIPGNTTSFRIHGIHWHNTYEISISSVSSGGESKIYKKRIDFGLNFEEKKSPLISNLNNRSDYIIGVSVAVAALISVLLTIWMVKRSQKRTSRNAAVPERNSREEEFNPLYLCGDSSSGITDTFINDEYEIAESRITLFGVIGEGAFGKVRKAELVMDNGRRTIVAIKMMKNITDKKEERSFMAEVEAMKQLGHHPNIVSMLGYCTKGPVLCLIMDYCPQGDLRKYLLNCRQNSMIHIIGKNKRNSDSGISQATHSPTEELSDASEEEENCLQEDTLLSYARQIAIGMEYLSERKFVHRDLATRNILMLDKKRLKISDFGLTRDVYETNVYQPSSARRLPYKWMAIESIHDQMFTIKSDVWSFGIVLWEIVTLGGCPYPGIPNEDLFRLLKDGYRMEMPENCSPEIYQIMLSTWHPVPQFRPSFTDLRYKLESMLETTKPYINLSVSVSEDYYQSDTSSADDAGNETDNTDNDLSPNIEITTPLNICSEMTNSNRNLYQKS